ncbi:MAG: hypothetical protein SGARI_003688 [Bacillariaceae sp.]
MMKPRDDGEGRKSLAGEAAPTTQQQKTAADKVPSSVANHVGAAALPDLKQPARKASSASTIATVSSFSTDAAMTSSSFHSVSEGESSILMPENLREPLVASGVQSLIAKEYPQTDDDCDLVDNFLASTLSEMDLFEKEKGNFELHGVPSDQDPPPALLEQCLKDLQIELCKISNKQAYDEALQQNADYVTNRKFQLMFLRCDRFDVQAAAQQMVWHFEVKRNIFGSNLLGRDISLSDMSSDDMEAFGSGVVQLLPERDPAAPK